MGRADFSHTVSMERLQTENGIYVLFLRQGGELLPRALPAFLEAAAAGAEAIYADEAYHLPNEETLWDYKPDYGPQTLLSLPYIGAPLTVREDVLERMEGSWDESPEDLARLALALQEMGIHPAHIPEVLLKSPRPSPIAYHPLVEASLKRRGIKALAVEGAFPGSCLVRFGIPPKTRIGVITPFFGDCNALQRTLAAVERFSVGLPFHCYVPFSEPLPINYEGYFSALEDTGRVTPLYLPDCKRAAELKNAAACYAKERLVLFLDSGVEPLSGQSMGRLAEWAVQEGIGAVGGLVLNPEGRIENAGFLLGKGDWPKPILAGWHPEAQNASLDFFCRCVRNASVVGGGVLMMERDRFLASRGFDETMPKEGMEAEFCIRLQRQGWMNVFHPEGRFLAPMGERPIPKGNLRMTDACFPFARSGDPMVSRNPEWNGNWILRFHPDEQKDL